MEEKHIHNRANDNSIAPFSKLTRREIEVVRLITRGHKSPAIAKRLYISKATVKTHRKNIYNKLKLHAVGELTCLAVKTGFVKL